MRRCSRQKVNDHSSVASVDYWYKGGPFSIGMIPRNTETVTTGTAWFGVYDIFILRRRTDECVHGILFTPKGSSEFILPYELIVT